MQLVIVYICRYEKNRCTDAIILIGIICPAYCITFPFYVCVNLLIFVPTLLLSFSDALPLSLSHTHSLSLSVSPLPSSLPLHFILYKPMANLFVLSLIEIKSSDKHRCFTQRAEHITPGWKVLLGTNTLA
jgi:hypothetical protein